MPARVATKSHSLVRLPRAQRREQIVRAAASAFLTSGYDKTSMEDIARSAGVTRLIVYRIFESKEALYLAVLNSVIDDLVASFDVHGAAVAAEQRSTVASILLGVARRQPDAFRLLWRHTSNQPEFHDLYTQFQAGAAAYAITLIADALPDPTMLQWAADSLVSNIYESICLWLDRGDSSRDDEFLEMLAEGIRATVQAWSRVRR
jgi:AcrR family transcriptional regulator